MPRRATKLTDDTRRKLLQEFALCGRLDRSCAAAGCSIESHYTWLKKYPWYAEAYEEARAQALDRLEDEAWRRAMHGVERPVTIAGEREVVTEYSDNILTWLLKCRKYSIFGDRERLEHSGPGGGPIEVSLADVLAGRRKAREEKA